MSSIVEEYFKYLGEACRIQWKSVSCIMQEHVKYLGGACHVQSRRISGIVWGLSGAGGSISGMAGEQVAYHRVAWQQHLAGRIDFRLSGVKCKFTDPLAVIVMKKKVVLERLSHLGASHLAIRFEIDREIISLVKRLPGIRFSATHRCWYLPLSRENHESILRVLGALAVIDDSALGIDREPPPRIVSEALERMTEKLILKGYSDNTQRTYLNQFKCFLLHYSGRAPVELAEQHITDYLLMIVREKKYSRSTHNQAINAIKFYYEQVLYESPKVYRVERPQKERRLPVILNEQEIAALFNAVENIKHKVMLMILYASGLRRSEVLNLLPGDVDFERGMIFIRGGKGRKDRQSVLSKSLKPLLDAYIKKYRPITWMFEGPDHKPYSATSLQVILRRAVKKAGIQKHVKLHSLRHSFATHLLEAGTSTRYIQVLLGHESSRTTEIYTHVANFGVDRVKSPLDHLNLDGLDGK